MWPFGNLHSHQSAQPETRTITLRGQEISYTQKWSRRSSSISLSIRPGIGLVVTCPLGVSDERIAAVILEKQDWILKHHDRYASMTPPITRRYTKHHRESARALAFTKCKQWNEFYQFEYGTISIRNQKTRWGSCSSSGNLNFNIRILDLPEDLVDYLVVHELCHLQHMNHSPQFWNRVAEAIPDYKLRRARLRALHIA